MTLRNIQVSTVSFFFLYFLKFHSVSSVFPVFIGSYTCTLYTWQAILVWLISKFKCVSIMINNRLGGYSNIWTDPLVVWHSGMIESHRLGPFSSLASWKKYENSKLYMHTAMASTYFAIHNIFDDHVICIIISLLRVLTKTL